MLVRETVAVVESHMKRTKHDVNRTQSFF